MKRDTEARIVYTCSQKQKEAIQKRCYWERKTYVQKMDEMWGVELEKVCDDEPKEMKK